MTAKQERAQRRKEELQRRRDLKAYLALKYGDRCMTCNDKHRDWRGIHLSHTKPLSLGGVTDKENCILECAYCHQVRHHQIKEG